ncbi:Uncharacterised protein [Mycobacteroides abscessus subsp. abscessus]|nr:Uncharacterised protein [Mycobacteroides abscessus subsp. abscessus]
MHRLNQSLGEAPVRKRLVPQSLRMPIRMFQRIRRIRIGQRRLHGQHGLWQVLTAAECCGRRFSVGVDPQLGRHHRIGNTLYGVGPTFDHVLARDECAARVITPYVPQEGVNPPDLLDLRDGVEGIGHDVPADGAIRQRRNHIGRTHHHQLNRAANAGRGAPDHRPQPVCT